MTQPKPKADLRWELLPIFLVVLSFALGFIFYGARVEPYAKTGQEQYGFEWETVFGMVQWGIPAASAFMYLVLSAGMWAVGRVQDPLKDWNYVARLLRRPETTDPSRKEAARATLIRAQFLGKIALALMALFAQWQYFLVVVDRLGAGLP